MGDLESRIRALADEWLVRADGLTRSLGYQIGMYVHEEATLRECAERLVECVTPPVRGTEEGS